MTSVYILLFIFHFFFNLNVLDLDNNNIDLRKLSDTSIILFYQSPSCHQCLIELSSAISELDIKHRIIIVIKSKDNFFLKVDLKNAVKEYLKFDECFYDIINKKDSSKNSSNSIFQNYKVFITPSILIINGSKEIFIPYEKLFNKSYTSETIKEEILNVLKE